MPGSSYIIISMLDELRKIDIFKDLPLPVLEKILSVARVQEIPASGILFQEQDVDVPVYFVLKGAVRVFRTSAGGREQNLTVLYPGDAFNLSVAFFPQGFSPASAVAVGAVRLMRISRDVFPKIVLGSPELSLAVLRELSIKLGQLTELVYDLSLRDVRSRLAKFLLTQHGLPGESIRWTHDRIAAQIGTSREVVSRLLRVFIQEAWIRMDRHRIIIADEDALKELTE